MLTELLLLTRRALLALPEFSDYVHYDLKLNAEGLYSFWRVLPYCVASLALFRLARYCQKQWLGGVSRPNGPAENPGKGAFWGVPAVLAAAAALLLALGAGASLLVNGQSWPEPYSRLDLPEELAQFSAAFANGLVGMGLLLAVLRRLQPSPMPCGSFRVRQRLLR